MMVITPKQINELAHPGFVLFEGMDFSGKSYLASKVTKILQEKYSINAIYNTNKGFLNSSLVDVKKINQMTPGEKVRYVLSCYTKDNLPSNQWDYKEIVQDRYIPSILFYGVMRANISLDKTAESILHSKKPKHIFFCEASYNDSIIRAKERKEHTTLEKMTLDNEQGYKKMQQTYANIISKFDVPTTIINTSKFNKEECINECIDCIMRNHLMDYEIPIPDLFVDCFASVFSTTVALRKNEQSSGSNMRQVLVTRLINSSDQFINILEDGRHRAFASYLLKIQNVSAHINYQSCQFDVNALIPISEFTFREEK